MSVDCSTSRRSGDELIRAQAQSQVQTFFDELKNGTQNYQTIASLDRQIVQAYRGRCILELLQNAHDALANARPDDPRQISFVLRTSPEPVLLIGNSGHPFRTKDFKGLCQLAKSPKDPNESVGNKGLGFRSVLEVSSAPEIWSTTPTGCDRSFVFRFDPSVSDRIAASAQEMKEKGLETRSPFDSKYPLVDWSPAHLDQYLQQGLNGASEAKNFLSPYLIPLVIDGELPEVDRLLEAKHVSIVRLPLDGGRAGSRDEAVQSVKDQLQSLDARSMVFLPHLAKLIIDIDGKQRILERVIEPYVEFTEYPQTRQQRLWVGHSGPAPDDCTTRQFQVWTRKIGGDNDPEQASHIRTMVEHLPNRWPEVNQVTVSIAVEEAISPDEGCFVIFLPTDMTTGTGTHINAPFYGSIDRRQIDLSDPYNEFLLRAVLDLILDATACLISDEPDDWRARAVIDLLSSTTAIVGQDLCLMDALDDRAIELGKPLRDLPLILCDDGWRDPCEARTMPSIPENTAISPDHWRNHATFAIVSTALDGRQSAVEKLIKKLGGSLSPTNSEWVQMIEHVATSVQNRKINVTWDDFLSTLIANLPKELRSEPRNRTRDTLAGARFLPDQEGHLISASDPAKLFFQPVRGRDDAAELVEDVPDSLKQRVVFLHRSVQTQQGPQGRSTEVQKFLEGRFARSFRRTEIFREVIRPALPSLPVTHGSDNAARCSEIFVWTLNLLGKDPPDELLPLLKHLPVACHGGWHAMSNAVFGPGWPGRHGDEIWALADDLPADPAARLRKTALLAPDDSRWGTDVNNLDGFFTQAGVFDGLRLEQIPDARFHMSCYSHEFLPDTPDRIPKQAWDTWREAVCEEVKPSYSTSFEYKLTGIQSLPEIHHIESLGQTGRAALSHLLLASLEAWPAGWESATISKLKGQSWSSSITSPLKYWLTTLDWLGDRNIFEPLNHRWLVPVLIIGNQSERFRHLNPLTVELARRLEDQPNSTNALRNLGLNVYPMEQDRTGPELLNALAAAWADSRIPTGRFDVFLGQVRDAWRHLDPNKGLPKTFLVKTGRRSFAVCRRDELADVYLPNNRQRTLSLSQHGKHILEMNTGDATRNAQALSADADIKRASALEERFLINGTLWTEVADGGQPLNESMLAWLPVTLLAIAAHGGPNPTGSTTASWRDAADKLRRAQIIECESIAVQLVDGDEMVAKSEPKAQWLTGDVLAIRHDIGLSYESLAPAAQDLLDRQDLLKDLRLVLRAISGQEKPSHQHIEMALELAEIDAQALADIHNHWAGSISLIVDRIRPVLALLGISSDGLDLAATDIEHLTEWLTAQQLQWPAPELLSAARQSVDDDHAMGMAAWDALGEIAQLPKWNATLARLGDRFDVVENNAADQQTAEHMKAATPLLRGLARHIAIKAGKPSLFHELEAVNRNVKTRADWPTRWWKVPFPAIINALRDEYAAVPATEPYLQIFDQPTTLENLHQEFHDQGIETDPDPYEIARRNNHRLSETLAGLHDLYRVWVKLNDSTETPLTPPDLPAEPNPQTYLHPWSQAEIFDLSIDLIADSRFAAECEGCTSLDNIRDHLDLDREAVEAQQRQRQEYQRKAERQRRTFHVAGIPFEVGAASYSELFNRLKDLPKPTGPQASRDEYTILTTPRPSGRPSENGGTVDGTSHPRQSPVHRELVGIVGEMHAYRFLHHEFGSAITPDAWVSEIRLQVLPLVPEEPDNTNDSYGFDFRFCHEKKWWHVEVKATAADDVQFDLGISEIETATRLARQQGGRWRILRIRNALSSQPEFDWLPNPFQEGFKELYRLHRGGMRVSYAREKT